MTQHAVWYVLLDTFCTYPWYLNELHLFYLQKLSSLVNIDDRFIVALLMAKHEEKLNWLTVSSNQNKRRFSKTTVPVVIHDIMLYYFSFWSPQNCIPVIAKIEPSKPLLHLTTKINDARKIGIDLNVRSMTGSTTPCSTWYRMLLTMAIKHPVYNDAYQTFTGLVTVTMEGKIIERA